MAVPGGLLTAPAHCPCLQAAMLQLRQERTTVIVAHRLSTVADADIILVMRQGSIAEMGRHGELLQQNGLYAEMWAKQQAGISIDVIDGAAAAGPSGSAESADGGSSSASNPQQQQQQQQPAAAAGGGHHHGHHR